jgi:hypothetical protein
MLAALVAWTLVSDKADIRVWQRPVEGTSLVEFRAEGTVEAGLPRVTQVMADTPRKAEWMPHLRLAKLLRETAPTDRLEYQRTSAPWPVKDRDFVFQVRVTTDSGAKTLSIRMDSIEDPLMPEQRGAVRGSMTGGLELAAEGAERTRVTLEVRADPRGRLPGWIVNLFQRQWPRALIEGIRSQVRKPDVIDHPAVKAAFR